jgi:ABC-type branched-subunit amino acid transport system ATPase component
LVGTPCQGVLKSKDASATRPYHAINPLDLRRLRIARTFQDGRLIDQLSVWDNLVLPIAETRVFKALRQIVSTTPPLRGTPSLAKGNLNARVTAVLQKINLTEYANAPVESLSYGQRKLVELGRAIIQDADIYLLDEPFTGLFAKMVDQVLKLIAELKQSGKTIVIIEHNMGLIRAVADHIIVLDHGQVLAHGAPDKVLKDENVQQAYLGV